MKAAAYARYSTDQQTENSIATQLDAITKYCAKNGHTIVAVFTDEARTGTNMERAGFQNMLLGASHKDFECVVIYDMTRGSRDVADWFTFRKLMNSQHITVLSVTEKLGDIDDPTGFMQELFGMGMGYIEVLRSRQKSIAGKIQKAKSGVFLGGFPPLGYDIDHKTRKYIINEKEADVVRLIFKLYAEGHSYDYILLFIKEKAIKGKRGRPVGKNSLYSILKNDRYIGVYSWNRYNNRHMHRWAGGKPTPEVETRIEDGIPAIIDLETWNKVRVRMDNNKAKAFNTAKTEYLLSGKIVCKNCGAAYTGKTNTNSKGCTTRYYVCGNKARTKTCDAKNCNADLIEEIVADSVRNWLNTVDYDMVAENMITMAKARKSEVHKEEIETLNHDMVTLRYMLTKCEDDEQRAIINKQLKESENKRKELYNAQLKDVAISFDKNAVIEQLKKDAQCTDESDIKRLIKQYVQKIYAYGDDIEVAIGVTFIVYALPKVPNHRYALPKEPFLVSLGCYFYHYLLLAQKLYRSHF